MRPAARAVALQIPCFWRKDMKYRTRKIRSSKRLYRLGFRCRCHCRCLEGGCRVLRASNIPGWVGDHAKSCSCRHVLWDSKRMSRGLELRIMQWCKHKPAKHFAAAWLLRTVLYEVGFIVTYVRVSKVLHRLIATESYGTLGRFL